MKYIRNLLAIAISMVVLGIGCNSLVHAQSVSPNYKTEEAMFGIGGELDASSPGYRAKQSAGELTVGNPTSATYQFQSGFNTTDQPVLEFAVNGGTYDLGVLDATITGKAAATFTVRNYLSNGYVVSVRGAAPSNSGSSPHTLTPLGTAAGSSPGTEQFGINLATNTNPVVGADPVQSPDSTFSFGSVLSAYANPNQFKFLDGDSVAYSPKSSGLTTYTMSIIANVARNTPAGQYGGSLNVQVVPTF